MALTQFEMDELRLKTERSRINAMGTNALQDSAAEAAPIEASIYTPQQSVTNVPVNPALQQAQTGFQVIPQGQPIPLVAPAPAQPPPIDTSKVTHLTTDAELAAMSKPKVKLEPMTLYSLGIAARGGDVEAQQTLQKQGITASAAALTNEAPAMTQMKAQIAARPGGEQILKPAERKAGELDQARIFNVLKQERDLKWDIEKKQYDEDLRNTELGLKKAALGQAPSIAAERELDISMKEAQLANLSEAQRGAELERQQTELENQQKSYFNGLLGIAPEQTAGAAKSTEQVEANIESAKTPQDIQATYNELKTALAAHGADQDTINGITVASMNASYRNPVELAVDRGAEYTPLYTVNNDNIKKVQADVDTALARKITPDDAVDEILSKNPDKAKDNQFMLDVSMAVWNTYNKVGGDALKKAQEVVTQSKVKALGDLMVQLPNPQTLSPQSIVAEQGNALSKATQEIKVATAIKPGMKDLLLQRAQERLGNFKNIDGMSNDEIQLALLSQMGIKNSGNPAMLQLISETAKRIATNTDRNLIPPALQQYMNAYVAAFAPVAAKAVAEQRQKDAEEQDKRAKVEKEAQAYAEKNKFVVEFEPQTHKPIYFLDAAGARAYSNEPSELGKKELADAAGKITADKLADPNFRRFLTKTPKEQNDVLDDIEGGKLAIEIDDKAFANSSVALKYKALTKEDLRLKLNALAKINGQPEIPVPVAPEPTESWHLSHLWDWIGEKQKPAVTVAVTTPVPTTPVETPVLQVGTVQKGYTYQGGDPADSKSWAKVSAPSETPPVVAPAPTKPGVVPTAVVTPSPTPTPAPKSDAEIKQAEIDAQNEKTFAARPKPLTREEELDKYKASMGIPTSKEESATAQAKRMDAFKNLTKDLPVNFQMPPSIENAGWYAVKNELIKEFDLGGFTTSQDIQQALVDKGLTDKQARQLINARFYLAKQKAKK